METFLIFVRVAYCNEGSVQDYFVSMRPTGWRFSSGVTQIVSTVLAKYIPTDKLPIQGQGGERQYEQHERIKLRRVMSDKNHFSPHLPAGQD
jgi:hypothetical protein